MVCALSGRQVVDQAERIFDVASWEIGLVFDDFATVLDEAAFGFFDIVYRYFQYWPERGTALDKQVDVAAMKADHGWRFFGYREPELFDVERGCVCWIFGLNENIGAERVCHFSPGVTGQT
jgi:hypothetical protein